VSRRAIYAYATVTFTKSASDLDPADINRVIAEATAAREPGLAVELEGEDRHGVFKRRPVR